MIFWQFCLLSVSVLVNLNIILENHTRPGFVPVPGKGLSFAILWIQSFTILR
jgi:hypothetical protein